MLKNKMTIDQRVDASLWFTRYVEAREARQLANARLQEVATEILDKMEAGMYAIDIGPRTFLVTVHDDELRHCSPLSGIEVVEVHRV